MQLLHVLQASLSPDASTRQQAEAALEAGARQPGFATALLSVVLAPEVAPSIRQLAAVVLKKLIKEHWTFEAPAFREPPIGEQEKAHLREIIPTGLADPNSVLRTAVAMVVANIAKWDCPQAWPALIPRCQGLRGSGTPGLAPVDGRWWHLTWASQCRSCRPLSVCC